MKTTKAMFALGLLSAVAGGVIRAQTPAPQPAVRFELQELREAPVISAVRPFSPRSMAALSPCPAGHYTATNLSGKRREARFSQRANSH